TALHRDVAEAAASPRQDALLERGHAIQPRSADRIPAPLHRVRKVSGNFAAAVLTGSSEFFDHLIREGGNDFCAPVSTRFVHAVEGGVRIVRHPPFGLARLGTGVADLSMTNRAL